jgi:type IV pilus assembly protein PilQ
MNYIKAEAVQKLLVDPKQTLLSKRGSALLDDRSNMMFVKDTPSRLDDVRAMIAKVDTLRQVMIEARIVEAGDSFAKNLGIRLGWNQTSAFRRAGDHISGNSTFNSPRIRRSICRQHRERAMPGTCLSSCSTARNTLTQFLATEISALEADGRGKVISSPRVMTANQVEAIIEQGVEIPYQQATSSGATSVSFRKANLSLKVKPQITPDGKITMTLDVNKDTPNTRLSTGAGVAIDTKHVKTEVLGRERRHGRDWGNLHAGSAQQHHANSVLWRSSLCRVPVQEPGMDRRQDRVAGLRHPADRCRESVGTLTASQGTPQAGHEPAFWCGLPSRFGHGIK